MTIQPERPQSMQHPNTRAVLRAFQAISLPMVSMGVDRYSGMPQL